MRCVWVVDNRTGFGTFRNGSFSGAFSSRLSISHSTFTFSEALCSSMSIAQAPVSTAPTPSLSAVKGPSRLLSSMLYRKMTDPILISSLGMFFLSVQVYSFRLRHCSWEAFVHKSTYPEYMVNRLVLLTNKLLNVA